MREAPSIAHKHSHNCLQTSTFGSEFFFMLSSKCVVYIYILKMRKHTSAETKWTKSDARWMYGEGGCGRGDKCVASAQLYILRNCHTAVYISNGKSIPYTCTHAVRCDTSSGPADMQKFYRRLSVRRNSEKKVNIKRQYLQIGSRSSN